MIDSYLTQCFNFKGCTVFFNKMGKIVNSSGQYGTLPDN
jgi:hypothetical protein